MGGRRWNDHVWVAGDGKRGLRGARGDRCKRCGLNRAKRNGARWYWFNGPQPWVEIDGATSAPACDPKRLQPDLFPAGKGHAADPVRVPSIGATRKDPRA